jgi:hypothetical protein
MDQNAYGLGKELIHVPIWFENLSETVAYNWETEVYVIG